MGKNSRDVGKLEREQQQHFFGEERWRSSEGKKNRSSREKEEVARAVRRQSGGSREWQRSWVALEMVVVMRRWWRRCGWMMVDCAAVGDGDGEDGWC